MEGTDVNTASAEHAFFHQLIRFSDLLLAYAKPPHGLQYTHILVSCQYILSDIDSLDYEDKHYQRRKTDLENRLYKTWNGHGYLDGEGK